jgi:hypothetical protein
MITILVINAVSSLLATVGIGGFLARENRRVRRTAMLQPLYVTTRTTTRPLSHR